MCFTTYFLYGIDLSSDFAFNSNVVSFNIGCTHSGAISANGYNTKLRKCISG